MPDPVPGADVEETPPAADTDPQAPPPSPGAEESPAAETPGTAPAEFKVVELVDVALALPAQFPTVTLQELELPYRQLTFSIGMADGSALAHAFREVTTPRPLTHELIVTVLQRFHIDVVAVRLIGRTGGVYQAELDLMGTASHEVVPCRPTDGLGIALRTPVQTPILCDERLLSEYGDVLPTG